MQRIISFCYTFFHTYFEGIFMIKKSILAGFILSSLSSLLGANIISIGGGNHNSSNYNSTGKKAEGSDNLLTFKKINSEGGLIRYPVPIPPPPPPPPPPPAGAGAPAPIVDWSNFNYTWNIESGGFTSDGRNGTFDTIDRGSFSFRVFDGAYMKFYSTPCGGFLSINSGNGSMMMCNGSALVWASLWRGGASRYRKWWFAWVR